MFFYLKNYINLHSMKKTFFYYARILSFKEIIFIFSQNIFAFKHFYFLPGVFCKKYMFIQSKINAFNEFYLFNDFR